MFWNSLAAHLLLSWARNNPLMLVKFCNIGEHRMAECIARWSNGDGGYFALLVQRSKCIARQLLLHCVVTPSIASGGDWTLVAICARDREIRATGWRITSVATKISDVARLSHLPHFAVWFVHQRNATSANANGLVKYGLNRKQHIRSNVHCSPVEADKFIITWQCLNSRFKFRMRILKIYCTKILAERHTGDSDEKCDGILRRESRKIISWSAFVFWSRRRWLRSLATRQDFTSRMTFLQCVL